jgi:thymidylate synthase
MNMTVLELLSDPMIHKAFPGGIEDLREYVMELSGAKDHWMKNMDDPKDTRWEYTYHWRLKNYGTWKQRSPDSGEQEIAGHFSVDQIDAVVQKLAQEPYTRRAQMITWMPNIDLHCYDPPCLQSLHYRVVEDEDGTWYLNSNVRFRSNDAWGANFMNMFGFVQFNKAEIAERLSERTGKRVRLGRMNWHADSYHIYGKDLTEFQKRLMSRIDEPFEKRVFNFYDPMIHEIYTEAEKKVVQKIDEYDEKHRGS